MRKVDGKSLTRVLIYNFCPSNSEGSYGTVYKGKYQNNPVALKMSKVACREDIIDLLKEAQLAISLPQNKNIANYIGVAVKDGKPVIVMELVTGGTLQNALLNKELSFVELHNIVLGIANGMNVLNKVGVVTVRKVSSVRCFEIGHLLDNVIIHSHFNNYY